MNNKPHIELPKDLHKRIRPATTPGDWISRYLGKVAGVRSERRPARGWLDDVPLSPKGRAKRKAILLRFGSNLIIAAVLFGGWPDAHAQAVFGSPALGLTVEAYNNATVAAVEDSPGDDDLQLDAALRLLGLARAGRLQIGARIVVEGRYGSDEGVDVGERSLLLLDRWGRIEVGNRQGLPDVLLGYAPNNFTFTSAEFGPASGRSLDPAGGLQTLFVGGPSGRGIAELSVLGFATSLFEDRSQKLIYVPPKTAGFLGGVSFSPDAGRSDDQYGELVQTGLTKEIYWGQNVVRFGGSYAWARGRGVEDLSSANVGVSLSVDDAWLLGLSTTRDGRSGLPREGGGGRSGSSGAVASANYNTGPWTAGGYLQWAEAEGLSDSTGNDRLWAAEIGVSYRTSKRLRLYGAYYRYRYWDEGSLAGDGGILLAGLRATL